MGIKEYKMNIWRKSVAMVVVLSVTLSSVSVADSISKLEYTKQLVKGLGFQVTSAEGAYKRETTESEDIIYTAFQMGLLKGVSWDFENPMVEEEREIILANAMAIHEKNNASKDESDSEIADQEEVEVAQESVTKNEIEWETQWGTIKQPTDFNVNDDIWTDEEFHNLLIENPRMFNLNVRARSGEDAERAEYYGATWYYNTGTKHIMLRGDVVGTYDDGEDLYNYIDLDEATNGRAFDIIKAVFYHGYKNNMGISFSPQADSQFLWIRLYEYDRGHKNLSLFIPYNSKKRDLYYDDIEGYDSSVKPVDTEWLLNRLWDWAIYEDNGLDSTEYIHAHKHKAFIQSYDFTEQHYADFIYGVCDYIYGDDGVNVYVKMMETYMREHYELFHDIEDVRDKRKITTNDHQIYISDQAGYTDLYGITQRK